MEIDTETVILLDTYEALLTETQAKILRMRFDEDLSLSEIGELCGISRQAARDAIIKGEQKLSLYEQTLKVAYKERRLNEIIALMTRDGAKAEHIKMLKDLTEES